MRRMALLLSLSLAAIPAAAADLNNISPTKDTYVLENAASSNFGGNSSVAVGNVGCGTCAEAIVLQYDVSAIPTNATVSSATLSFSRIATNHSGSKAVALRRHTASWSEGTATWSSIAPAGDTIVGSATLNTGLSFPTITTSGLTTLVQEWVSSPSSNRGIVITGGPEQTYISFHSKEGSGSPIRLSVNYTVPTPGPNGLCYVDLACSSGNQYSVRDSGNGQCVAPASCTEIWKCAAGPTSRTCGGGITDCGFSPGCPEAVQTCFDGFCLSISQCNDRIKYQGYSPAPTPNQCDCAGNPPAAGGSCPAQSYTLNVTKTGSGSGTVSSNPAGISCGAACSTQYTDGTSVTLSAAPASGSQFSGWSGACTGTGACVVSMTADRSVTATFSPIPSYTLSVTKAGTGSGTVNSSPAGINCGATCSASFQDGTSVTLTPTPAANSQFTGWSGACSGTGACVVSMTAARGVGASFAATQQPSLTVTKAGTGSGTVTSSPAGINCGVTCSATYVSGTAVTLNAAPAAGSVFAGWSGACSGNGACVVTMNGAQSVTATFQSQCSVSVTKSGAGSGTVTSTPGGINCGSACSVVGNGSAWTLTATPATGSTFGGWSGACSGTGTCNVTCGAVNAAFNAVTNTSRIVRVVASSGAPGGSVAIPIELVSQGDENSLGFSVTFNPALLSNPQVAAGSDAASALLNTNATQAASGRVGIALSLPAGQSFASGTRRIAVVTFGIAASASGATEVSFGDQPITREVASAAAVGLAAQWNAASVTFSTGYEADVAPRNTNGNQLVTTTDWVQVGRFAAQLDTALSGVEFQKADCAPRSTLGNGAITTIDWVQAGRYAAALDSLTAAGGPSSASSIATIPATTSADALASDSTALMLEHPAPARATVVVDATGVERAIGFSIAFDPRRLRFVSVSPGATLDPATAILVNENAASEGHVGIVIGLPPDSPLARGLSELVTFEFEAIAGSSAAGVEFSDVPVVREIAAGDATRLPSVYREIRTPFDRRVRQ